MTAAEKFARLDASRARRSTADVTTERRPMPTHSKRLGRLTDFTGVAKAWRVVKVNDDGRRVVLSAHDKEDVAHAHAGAGRDALSDADVGANWNVVAERRPRGKR